MMSCQNGTVSGRCRVNTVPGQDEAVPERRRVNTTSCQDDTV